MKRTGILFTMMLSAAFLSAAMLFVPNSLMAQEVEKEHVVKVKKVMVNEDGEEIIMDTTYTVTDGNIEDLMKIEADNIIIKGDEKAKVYTISVDESGDIEYDIIKEFQSGEDGEQKVIIKKYIGEDGEENHDVTAVFISDDSLKEIEHKIEVITSENGEDVKIMKWVGDDSTVYNIDHSEYNYSFDTDDGHKIIMIKSTDGEPGELKHIIMNDCKGLEGEMMTVETEVDESGDQVTIRIKKKIGVETVCVIEHEDEEGNVVTKKVKMTSPNEEDAPLLKEMNIDSETEELDLGDFRFYPNPSDGRVSLEFELKEDGPVKIKVYDSRGALVLQEKIRDAKGTIKKELDLTANGEGIYFVQVEQNKKSLVRKVVIE